MIFLGGLPPFCVKIHWKFTFSVKIHWKFTLKELKAAAGEVPLVLHGGSGTPEDQLAQVIEHGIAKINIYSELTAAWNTTMRDFLNKCEQMICWFVVACKEPDAAMRKVMREKMRMFKSEGKY